MKEHIKYAASCGPTILGLCRTQKKNQKQMLCDLIAEAGRWELVRKADEFVVD